MPPGPSSGSICAREDRIKYAEPVVGTARLQVEQEPDPAVVPALRRQAVLGRPAERPGDERGQGRTGNAARLQEGADDGPEGAVDRVGQLGRGRSGVGVDLLAQLVADGPGDPLDEGQGLGRDVGVGHRTAPRDRGGVARRSLRLREGLVGGLALVELGGLAVGGRDARACSRNLLAARQSPPV